MKEINPEEVIAPDIPFSMGIEHDGWIFVAGQVPRDGETGEILTGDIAEQTRQTLENVSYVVEAGGGSLASIVKVNVFLRDMNDYDIVSDTYREIMPRPYPVQSAIEASDLAKEFDIEMDAIAFAH